ncbi:hypothetical protein GCM10025734_44760 [Kitasatospora paranensis]
MVPTPIAAAITMVRRNPVPRETRVPVAMTALEPSRPAIRVAGPGAGAAGAGGTGPGGEPSGGAPGALAELGLLVAERRVELDGRDERLRLGGAALARQQGVHADVLGGLPLGLLLGRALRLGRRPRCPAAPLVGGVGGAGGVGGVRAVGAVRSGRRRLRALRRLLGFLPAARRAAAGAQERGSLPGRVLRGLLPGLLHGLPAGRRERRGSGPGPSSRPLSAQCGVGAARVTGCAPAGFGVDCCGGSAAVSAARSPYGSCSAALPNGSEACGSWA